MTTARYEQFLRGRHRPAHGRRTVATHAAFLVPHLKPGMRVLDLGCGPASITSGLAELAGEAVGVDLSPGPASTPLVAADAASLPFPDASFDAVFSSALLQHVVDPLAVLREARRVCRPGAVIGVADADWGGALRVPDEPLIARGEEIQVRLRAPASPFIGRHLRGLLHEAGFERAASTARGGGGGDERTAPAQAAFQAGFFTEAAVVEHVEAMGLASRAEMGSIAEAWRSWGDDGAAISTGWWFEAVAWAPG